jgi:hypothetical protein
MLWSERMGSAKLAITSCRICNDTGARRVSIAVDAVHLYDITGDGTFVRPFVGPGAYIEGDCPCSLVPNSYVYQRNLQLTRDKNWLMRLVRSM